MSEPAPGPMRTSHPGDRGGQVVRDREGGRRCPPHVRCPRDARRPPRPRSARSRRALPTRAPAVPAPPAPGPSGDRGATRKRRTWVGVSPGLPAGDPRALPRPCCPAAALALLARVPSPRQGRAFVPERFRPPVRSPGPPAAVSARGQGRCRSQPAPRGRRTAGSRVQDARTRGPAAPRPGLSVPGEAPALDLTWEGARPPRRWREGSRSRLVAAGPEPWVRPALGLPRRRPPAPPLRGRSPLGPAVWCAHGLQAIPGEAGAGVFASPGGQSGALRALHGTPHPAPGGDRAVACRGLYGFRKFPSAPSLSAGPRAWTPSPARGLGRESSLLPGPRGCPGNTRTGARARRRPMRHGGPRPGRHLGGRTPTSVSDAAGPQPQAVAGRTRRRSAPVPCSAEAAASPAEGWTQREGDRGPERLRSQASRQADSLQRDRRGSGHGLAAWPGGLPGVSRLRSRDAGAQAWTETADTSGEGFCCGTASPASLGDPQAL